MNLKYYEKRYFSTYEAFAETVRFKALLAAEDLPRPQSVQCRAKAIESLRHRLAETGELNTQTLEFDRCDLAGARLIFYTNNDVEDQATIWRKSQSSHYHCMAGKNLELRP